MARARFTAHIDRYVDSLKSQGSIESKAIEAAFRRVPRHRLLERFFVSKQEFSSQSGFDEVVSDPEAPNPEHLELIYSSRALVTRLSPEGAPSSSTSMPALVAQMLELLQLEPGHRVFEIGAGTGYNAALISEIVGDQSNVVTIDIQEDVVEQTRRLLEKAGYGEIKILAGDGFFGVPEEAPFDRMVATVGLFDVSHHWIDQLADKGQMLLPLYQGGACPLVRLRQEDGRLKGTVVGGSGFMPIQGEMVADEGSRPQFEDPGESPTGVDQMRTMPGWDIGEGMGSFPRFSLWYLVTASDQRASLLSLPGQEHGSAWIGCYFGLADERGKVVHGPDELVLVGETDHLLERFDQLREMWEKAGRPAAGEYEVELLPKDAFNPDPEDLAIERKHHWQVLRLPEARHESD